MKVMGYCALHYGADYIKYALESVYNDLDEILILYTDKPSHGSGTSLTCPDSEKDLIEAIGDLDTEGKIIWQRGHWSQENQQRNYAHDYARGKGYDILVVVDADEVWKPQYLPDLIKLTYERKANHCKIWMRHLWRSFNFICDDPMRQERIYYLGSDKTDIIYAPQPVNQVWHFGYARTIEDVAYKISIHGHSSEWLQNKTDWLMQKYAAFPPTESIGNVHPACDNMWFPKAFDKTELPELMRSHPWYNVEEIK